MVHESTDISNFAQLSPVLHYVSDRGTVKVYVLKVKDVMGCRREEDFAALISNFLEEYDSFGVMMEWL